MKSTTNLDPVDQRLIALLRENARTSTAALARQLGLSRTTVQSRIERLERANVILGYSIQMSEAQENGAVRAYVMITMVPRHAERVAAALRTLPAVRRLEAVSGGYDFIAVVVAGSVPQMDALIDSIGALEGVERTTTSIALSTKFSR